MRFSAIITFAVVAISGAMPALSLEARAATLPEVVARALKRADSSFVFNPSRFHFRIGTTMLPNTRELDERMVIDPSHFRIGTAIRPNYSPKWAMDAVARDDQLQVGSPSVSGYAQQTLPTFDGPPHNYYSQVATSAGNFGPSGGSVGNMAGFGGRPHGPYRGYYHHHHPGGNSQGFADGSYSRPTGSQQVAEEVQQQQGKPMATRSWSSRRASAIYSVNGVPYRGNKSYFILP